MIGAETEAKLKCAGAWVVKNAAIVAAVGLLIVAVVLAIADRVPAASLMAGLFVVVVLFHYLPEMESFKAYGIEAKLRQRLNRADEILLKLKQTALASARLTYHTLGWGSRMGGHTQHERQAIADATDAALLSLGVEATEIDALKRDYILFALYDLFQCFDGVVGLCADKHLTRVRKRDDAADVQPEEKKRLADELKSLHESRGQIDLLDELGRTEFNALVRSRIPATGISVKDMEIINSFADQVCRLAAECKATGRVTEATNDLIDKNSTAGRQALYRELFNEEPG